MFFSCWKKLSVMNFFSSCARFWFFFGFAALWKARRGKKKTAGKRVELVLLPKTLPLYGGETHDMLFSTLSLITGKGPIKNFLLHAITDVASPKEGKKREINGAENCFRAARCFLQRSRVNRSGPNVEEKWPRSMKIASSFLLSTLLCSRFLHTRRRRFMHTISDKMYCTANVKGRKNLLIVPKGTLQNCHTTTFFLVERVFFLNSQASQRYLELFLDCNA